MDKKACSIARLKAGLSSILADVARGGEVVITDHNRPVARLVSVRPLPPLPRWDPKEFLSHPRIKLRKGAPAAAELVRELRDEGYQR